MSALRRRLLLALALAPLALRAQARELRLSIRQDPPHDRPSPAAESNARVVRTRPVIETIRVREGERALVALPTAIPMTFRRFALGAASVDEVRGTVHYEALARFAVRATVGSAGVTLELAPQDAAMFAESARVMRTLQGRVGEWIEVGDAVGSAVGVWLRVEIAAPR